MMALTVRELMDILKEADPDDSIICLLPDTNPYSDDEVYEQCLREDMVAIDSYRGVVFDFGY